jgi:hypothetical protein
MFVEQVRPNKGEYTPVNVGENASDNICQQRSVYAYYHSIKKRVLPKHS